ncbi:uncharacterized protein LOC133039435 [Cannabis sativa]|uniref:uncharacterized protein LOC133039435 n=1 Tax=Cannabis sativa TaxID=3483 RepID=UPI0029CA1248|nr:uncharacterized protein LOC133039435 [Cannabis sativa]
MEPKNLIKPTCSFSSSSSSTKSIFKDNNGRSCTSFKESVSSNEFVDKKSGGLRLKDESTYCRRDKYDNKNEEFVHEYETKLKFTHLSYPNNQQHLNYYNAHHDDDEDDDDDLEEDGDNEGFDDDDGDYDDYNDDGDDD